MLLGVVVAIFIGVTRIPASLLAMLGSKLDGPSKQMVVFSVPRGMAAGVLATLPAASGVDDTAELPVLVFPAIVTTIVMFAAAFPAIRKQLPVELDDEVKTAGTEAAAVSAMLAHKGALPFAAAVTEGGAAVPDAATTDEPKAIAAMVRDDDGP
jgi:hypothetical protein